MKKRIAHKRADWYDEQVHKFKEEQAKQLMESLEKEVLNRQQLEKLERTEKRIIDKGVVLANQCLAKMIDELGVNFSNYLKNILGKFGKVIVDYNNFFGFDSRPMKWIKKRSPINDKMIVEQLVGETTDYKTTLTSLVLWSENEKNGAQNMLLTLILVARTNFHFLTRPSTLNGAKITCVRSARDNIGEISYFKACNLRPNKDLRLILREMSRPDTMLRLLFSKFGTPGRSS